jgi:acetyl esterase/lipase
MSTQNQQTNTFDLLQTYDPELVAALQTFPGSAFLDLIDWHDLPTTREKARQVLEKALAGVPNSAHVSKEDRRVPGPEDAPEVPVRIYRPVESTGTLPGLVWFHGGGLVMGNIEQDDLILQSLVEEINCVIVSVEYRLAPEHPYPAPVEDCYAALKWTADHAAELRIDPARIAVGGSSSGGSLAASVALLARDRGQVAVAFQLLIYPMIDDRDKTPSSETFADAPIWSRQDNQQAWRAYLGNEAGGANVSPYAAPSRVTDLAGLPPAYVTAGSQEIFLDEDVEYALRLARTGIPVELHVYPRAYHEWFRLAPTAAVSQQFFADLSQALKRVLHPAFSAN